MRLEILECLVEILNDDDAVEKANIVTDPHSNNTMLHLSMKNGEQISFCTSGYRGTYGMWEVARYFDMIGEFR